MIQFSHQIPHKGQSFCIALPEKLQVIDHRYLESYFAIIEGSPTKEIELFEKVQRQ